jgi:hypothetical protein
VELLPAFLPVRRHVGGRDGTERGQQPRLASRVGVGRQHDLIAAVGFLEALGKEREHLGARALGRVAGDGDRDPSDAAQRKALFSLSKNPSSLR